MNKERMIWTILFVCGALYLALRVKFAEDGVGNAYVAPVDLYGQIDPATKEVKPVEADTLPSDDVTRRESHRFVGVKKAESTKAIWSPSRTIGIWAAAFLTFCAFSYLYRDNPFYKLAESIIVGVSAGYWIVLSYWEVLVAKVLVKISPDIARYAFLPDTPANAQPDYWYLVPVILGCMVFCRWIPSVSWLGRWPLAFVVGTTAGLKLIFFLEADFVSQIRSTIIPLIVMASDDKSRNIDWKQSIQNIVLVISVLSSITYFYFSVEHKGIIGKISRLGIWVLMITFGASFAFTVMGRITLLTMRLQFLFEDWLGVVKL